MLCINFFEGIEVEILHKHINLRHIDMCHWHLIALIGQLDDNGVELVPHHLTTAS